MTLRDYQVALIQQVYSKWEEGVNNVLLQCATGTGKTVIGSYIVQQYLEAGYPIIVVAHREEILLQTQQTLERQGISHDNIGILKHGYRYYPDRPIQLASVQTLVRRTYSKRAQLTTHHSPFTKVGSSIIGLIIIDEAHRSASTSYKTVLSKYPGWYVLGLTATPIRLDGKGLGNIYETLIYGPPVKSLIKQGYLVPYRLVASPRSRIVISKKIKVINGDYSLKELDELVENSIVVGDLYSSWEEYNPNNKRTILYAVNVKHSKRYCDGYKDRGVKAAHIDGETSATQRHSILEDFRRGNIHVLTNCLIATEGLDIPEVECIQCVRPTKSLSLYLQMLGRGLRVSPNKSHVTFIDHTDNWILHGLPDEDRQWTLDGIAATTKELQPPITCPICYTVYRGCICPNCGKENNLPNKDIYIHNNIELQEIPNVEGVRSRVLVCLQKLKDIQARRQYKPQWIAHRLIDKFPDITFRELEVLAQYLNYNPNWAHHFWNRLHPTK